MSKKADEGWSGKKVPLSRIPPHKAPRQSTRVSLRGKQRVVELTETQDKEPIQTKQTVVDIVESQDQASDSEEDTQFGVVWEKIKEVETLKDKHVTVIDKYIARQIHC
jgi:hypothetical protein